MAQNEHIVYHSRKNLTQMAVVTLFGIVALPFQLIVAVRQHTVAGHRSVDKDDRLSVAATVSTLSAMG